MQQQKEENTMLASEIKATNILRQREYIERMLEELKGNDDGDMCFPYVGVICPENLTYFGMQNVRVCKSDNQFLSALTGGRPIYIISVDEAEVTDDELKKAMEESQQAKSSEAPAQSEDSDAFNAFFEPPGARGSHPVFHFPFGDFS